MYGKLCELKKCVEYKAKQSGDDDFDFIVSMIDECIYATGTYRNGTTKRLEAFSRSDIHTLRKKERQSMTSTRTNERLKHVWKDLGYGNV